MNSPYLSVTQAAKLLGVSRAKLYSILKKRRIAYYNMDGLIRIPRENIEAYKANALVKKARQERVYPF